MVEKAVELMKQNGVTGIILAGGKSQRMGQNKALLPIQGIPNIERIKLQLEKVVCSVLIVANDPQPYEFLKVNIVEDIVKEQGPLGGIHVGLLSSRSDWNLIVACDLPFIDVRIGSSMLEHVNGPFEAIVPKINGRIHPLYALYHKNTLAAIESSISNKMLRMTELLSLLNVHYITENDLKAKGIYDEEIETAFYNMNNPEDYKRITSSTLSSKN